MPTWREIVFAGLVISTTTIAVGAEPPPDSSEARHKAEQLDALPPVHPPANGIHVDASGRKEVGRASYYAHEFANRRMADGHRMNPNSNIAASKTLPLGSVAKVTNMDNGKTATVRIEDRGPFKPGRVVDVAPKVADDLALKKDGVAPVEVKPITVPQPDGAVKLGAGAASSSPEEVRHATEVTKELAGSKASETAER